MAVSELLKRVERGEWPSTDPWLEVVPQPSLRAAAVLAFAGHIVVAADVEPGWVMGQLRPADLSGAMNPPFLSALERRLTRRVNSIDMVLLADPLGGAARVPLHREDDADHPRVRRAHRYRDDVQVWSVEGAVLVLGRGFGGRWEAAIEVAQGRRGAGLGRLLATAARHLVPERRPVWAQIAPGNAASVRAFLAAGYRPVGAEALLVSG